MSELGDLPCAQLFRLCAEHPEDGEYWEEFYKRYHAILGHGVHQAYRRFAAASHLAEATAADLLQDTYAKILKDDCLTLRRFRGATEAEARVYLLQTAINVTADHLRQARARKRRGEMLQLGEVFREDGEGGQLLGEQALGAWSHHGYTDRIAVEELVKLLRSTFTGPHARRDILLFLLHVREGLTAREIASLGIWDLQQTSIAHTLLRMKSELRKKFPR